MPDTGIVTTALLTLLKEQLERHSVVVWFDPHQDYTGVAQKLSAPGALLGTHFATYDPQQGFFALRRALEPLWKASEPPRLLIYVPLASKDTHNALAEYLAVGARLEPGQTGSHNTRLHILARHALQDVLPAATLEKLLREIESGKLSLAEIDAQAERGQDALLGVLSLIFEGANAEEIALHFLCDPAIDLPLAARSAGPALVHLLNQTLDVDLGAGDNLAVLRAALGRHLLTVEFLLSLAGSLPERFKTIPLPAGTAARETAVRLTRTWRQRRDLAPAYLAAAQKLEVELGLGSMTWSIPALRASETFLLLEGALQTLLEQALTEKPEADLLALAEARLTGFWPAQQPEVKLRWQVILDAARVLLQSQVLRQALKNETSAAALFKRYTASEAAWCELDTAQRHLERDAHNFDADPQAGDSNLKLAAAARRAYAESVHQLASRFVRAYEAAGFSLPGVLQQVEIYHDFVEPAASEASTAYFLVDAFRFEMARELCAQLPTEWKATLNPALAVPPTITEIGMAALLPWAERGLVIGPAGPGKLGVSIGATQLRNRPERMNWLEEKGPKALVVTELNKIAPLKDKTLRAGIKSARLVVVTASDEIDGLWESQPHTARRLHDDVFEQLKRGMRTLFSLGIRKIILTADHGFLSGESLMQGDALDAPGGETADLHRRMWVGKGGAAIEACLRRPLSAFGNGGDLELVTPYGMSIFKVAGGSNEYFHGGLSLQELVIPVISVSAAKVQSLGAPTFTWDVKPGSQKITSRFFSVTISASMASLEFLLAAPPRLRVELRAGNQVISVPVAASYGFNDVTREVSMIFDRSSPEKLIPNTITLHIPDVPTVNTVTLTLLDEFGASLYETSLPLAIAF